MITGTLILAASVSFSGCLATSDELSGVRDDMHELLLKLNVYYTLLFCLKKIY